MQGDGCKKLELVVLEQMLQVMAPRACHWIACLKQISLKVAEELWKNFLAANGVEKMVWGSTLWPPGGLLDPEELGLTLPF